ncbi:MAG: recombinase RecA [Candidatus Proteinoplasmatales archaeon SG8-5]|nr:MAG: recombinase RecA [Candidatus Proteinoplasmatales archaeon SG8-5]
MVDSVSFGIPALDKAIMDGIPKGYTVLCIGMPGAGVELFAKRFASAGAKNENVTYFSTSERDDDVLNTMKDFGWSTDMKIVNIGTMYYEKVLARHLDVSKYRHEGLSMMDIRQFKSRKSEEPEEFTTNFLTTLTYEVSKLSPPFRIVLDSLNFFLEYYPHDEVLSALRTIKAHTQHNEGVALVTLVKGVLDSRTESGIEEIVDAIIELERQRDGYEFKRNLLIRKVRNHPEKTGILAYTIDDKGISAKGV